MNKVIFSKDFFLIIIFLLMYLPITYLIIKAARSKDKEERKKLANIIAISIIICYNLPVEKLIDKIPFQFNIVDEAFRFDYNNNFKLVFKEKYKDTYFVMGKSTDINSPFDKFSCYYKTKNGWRTLIQPSDTFAVIKNDGIKDVFINKDDVFIFNNKADNVTGVFIAEIVHGMELNEKSRITDKYGTEFKYITENNGKVITYNDSKSYVYFGIVKHNITDDYYIKVDGEKITFDK